jgi:hypothetical protein
MAVPREEDKVEDEMEDEADEDEGRVIFDDVFCCLLGVDAAVVGGSDSDSGDSASLERCMV